MNIYAVRDRLLNHFRPPFLAPDDYQVKASLAQAVNSGEQSSDIAQAPHHFELWRIGHITAEAHVQTNREFLCDCSSLIRTSVRDRQPGVDQAPEPANHDNGLAPRDRGRAADPRPLQDPQTAADSPTQGLPTRPR